MAQAIRIRYASTAQNKSDEFDGWLDGWTEAKPGRTSFSHNDFKNRPTDGTPYYEVRVWLDDSEDLATALNELSEDVFAGVKWYVVHTHDCTHDRDGESADCSWTLEDERGNVPEEYR